ncbi:MAG: hypothetical protein ABW135_16080 [Thermoleophilaceae bacterium]
MERNTVLWTLVLFFGASLMFSTIRKASEGEGIGITLAAQISAGVLLVVFIVLYMRSRDK